MSALAFVPVKDVEASFDELSRYAETSKFSVELDDLLEYYENNYIGRPKSDGKRKKPRYDHAIWYLRALLEFGEPTTSNGIESSNGQMLRTMAASHPTIWKLIEGLRLELKMAERKMGAYRAGENTPRRGIAYRHINDRLKNVVKRYAEMPKIEFLMAIAANLSCAMIDFSSSANVLEPTRKRHNVDTLPGRGKSVPSSKRQKLDEEVIVCSSDFVQNTKRNSVLLEKEPNSFIAIEKDDQFPCSYTLLKTLGSSEKRINAISATQSRYAMDSLLPRY
uniref:Uncharacterized protein n=1 Tax=Ditylenchus dipsaci TaxID=166011 RepID=A0A915DX72_9BILA